jgi:hypothetical protein
MIQIIRHRSRYVSVVTCDTCGKRITDSTMAAALDGPGRVAWHVHKGRCHDDAERRARAHGWMTLRDHLDQIVHNSQMPGEYHDDGEGITTLSAAMLAEQVESWRPSR